MANGGSIKYTVGFNVDKSGLNQLKASLQELKQMTAADLIKINPGFATTAQAEIQKIRGSIGELETALNKAFNTNLGTLNISKFNQELKKLNLNAIYADMSKLGAAGQNAFRNTTAQILTTNMQLKQTHSLINNMATTMANTVKWGVASSIMNGFTRSVRQAYSYVKRLDTSLNDIRIVTGKSADEMERFATKANNVAKALGQSTTNYTEASLIYYQQGLSDKEVAARAETTLKAANVTGQTGEEVSEQLTAVWNGYKVSAEEAELYVDKLAAVASKTASNLEELSTGMSKVASAANAMGVDADQLNAQLATIVSVTRQAPESVGTALKTIYARMSDLKLGETDEDGLGLGDVSGQMEAMGIDVLDATGNLRDMGAVIEDVAAKWDTWTEAQKTAMAQVMAGKRQYNNLVALFENWDMYEMALDTSQNSAGTLQRQQDTYMESMKAHLNQLKASTEDLYDSLLDPKGLNPLIDGLTGIVDLFGNFIDSIGGGAGALLLLGTLGTKVFNQQLSSGITTFIMNMMAAKENAAQLSAEMAILNQFENANISDPRTQELIHMKRQILDLNSAITNEERNISNEYINQTNELFKQQDKLTNNLSLAQQLYNDMTGQELNMMQTDKGIATDLEMEKTKFDAEHMQNIEAARKAQMEMTAANREYGRSSEEATEKTRVFVNTIKEQIEKSNELIINNQVYGKSREALSKALKDCNQYEKENGKITGKNVEEIQLLQNVQNAYKRGVEDTSKALKQSANNMSNQTKETENVTNAIQNAKVAWVQFINKINLRANVQQMMSFVSSIGRVAMGINSLRQISSTLKNDDLGVGEKTLQIVMSLSMGLPMLINGIMKSISSFTALKASLIETIALISLKNKAELESIGISEAASIKDAMVLVFKKAGVELTEEEIKKLTIKNALKTLENKLQTQGIAQDQVEIAMTELKTVVNEVENTSLLKNIGLTMLKHWWILAIVAAAGLAAYGIYKMVEAYNADAEAAKESAEQVKILTERYNELNEKAEQFKKTVSEYDDAVKALEELTKETDEYEDAVDAANKKAKELIETYGLFGDYSIDSNGLIQIDENALKNAQTELDDAANKAQRQMYGGQIYSTQANLRNERTNTKRDIGNVVAYEATSSSGNSTYTSYRQFTDSEMDEITAAFQQATVENMEGYADLESFILDKLTPALKDDIDAIMEHQDKFEKLADSTNSATEANEYYAKQIMGMAVEDEYGDKIEGMTTDKDGNINEVLYNQIVAATAQRKSEAEAENETALAERMADIEDDVRNIDSTGELEKYLEKLGVADNYNVSNDKQLALTYAEMMGYGDRDTLTYKGGNGKGSITDASGEKVMDGVSDEVMRREIAKQAAYNQIVDSYASETEGQEDDFMNALETMMGNAQSAGAQYGTDFSTSLLAAITNGNLEEEGLDFSSIIGDLNPDEVDDLKTLSTEEIAALFGLTEDELTALAGIEADKFAEKFRESLSDYDADEYKKAADAEGDKKAKELDLDVDELDAYRDLLADTYEELDNNREALNEVAIANKRMEKGVKALCSKWEDFDDIMSDSESSMEDISSILPDINDGLQDVLNLSDEEFELLPPDFAQKNWSLIQDVVNGVDGAVDELRDKAGEEILMNISGTVDANGQLKSELAALHTEIASFDQTQFKVGVAIDPAQYASFFTACNEMINAAGMTAAQAQAYFKSMGYDAEVEKVIVPPEAHPWSVENPIFDPEASEKAGVPVFKGKEKLSGINYSGGGEALAVKTITPNGSYGGGVGVKTTAPKSSTSGKKSSGGGGGGSKPKKEDKVESKKDRYHDVNVKLKQLDEELEDIGRDQKKLFGADLLKALNKELDVLEKQRDVLNDKLELAKEERDELKKKLQDQGVQFNEDDTIKNYAKIVDDKEKALNQMIEDFNKLSAAEQEKQQEKLDQAKEDYEKFMEMIGEYEDVLLDTIPEIENQLDDITDREIEIQIQKLNMEVELRLDLTQAQKDWNEFKREVIDGIDSDDIFGNAKADAELFNTLMGNQTTEALTHNINTTMDQIDSINKTGTSSIYGNDKNAALENLEEQMSNLMDHMTELNDLQKQISEAYLDMIDEVGEAFDEQIESYEYVGDLINHNMELIKLVKGEDAWADLQASSKQRNDNNLQALAKQKAAVDYYRQMMDTETDEKAKEKWTQMWKDGVSELKSLTKQTIEDALEDYEIAVNKIFDDLDDKMTNGKGLDYLTQEWELKNENADQYLDTINSTYEVQKLERKIQDSINNTDSLSAQKQLNKLMDDELKKLREKEKLTKYDIDRANAMYEIKLKEIALEEAQQNKSQMRLRRDASGNYSYQFVADQDSISKAQQELDDARNSLYNMDKDEYRENQQAILDVYTEFQEKMRDAANLSAEEKKLIEEQYNERINALLEENGYIRNNLMESTFNDLAALYGSDVANFQQMSAEEQEILMGQIVPTWNSGIQEMIDTMVGENGFGPSCKAAMEELNLVTLAYDDLLGQIQVTAGETADQLSQGYDINIEKAKELAEAQQANIDKTIEEKNATLELKNQVDALALSYKDVYENAKKALEQAQKVREHELEEAARKAAEEAGRDPGSNAPSGENNPSGSDTSNNPSSNNGKHQLTSDIIDGIAGAIWYWSPSAWGNGEERRNKINSKFGSGSYEKVQSYINDHVTVGGKMKKAFKYGWGDRDKYKQYYYSKFDTGGYTGDWAGNDGKAAILHKKELVLNANDTKNFLSAIHLVRDMESMLGALNDSMLSRTSGMTASLAPSLGFEDSAQNTVNQNVSIQASFPGVSSRAEIEDAFRNLVNIASQHAFNTQR